METVRRSFEGRGIPEAATNIIMSSWRQSTQKQYSGFIERWIDFCSKRATNPMHTNAVHIVTYLTELFNVGLSYNSLNVARSALSSFVVLEGDSAVGNHPLISRFLKGAYTQRPPAPRYSSIWDVQVVFDYLHRLSPAGTLSLKDLTLKLAMLIGYSTEKKDSAQTTSGHGAA
ncbi:uncharacterized protein LOC119728693 [Patiria miniata]|uniref:Integrase SAM-like N-terminal domain-containing protein n=1 Tax=Patiria miniata TaxID=46514 RepID=A0A914A041_PATMI|nr:uncharacterized protein LOC119728693 [Patiria miniata]